MMWHTWCRQTRIPIHSTILLVGLVLLRSGAVADATTLRMVTWLPSQTSTYRILQAWADEVHKASGGSLTVAIDPKPTTRPTQQYDLVKKGEADLAWLIPTYNAERFPMLLAAELPFLSAHPVTDSRALWEWYTTHIGDREFGTVKLLALWLPGPALLHGTRAIKRLEDLKNLKLRVPGGVAAEIVQALGAVPLSAPMTKLAELLQQGKADGTLTGVGPVKLFRLQSVLTYHLEAPEAALYTTPFSLVMNRDRFASLSPAQQGVLEKLSGNFAADFISKRMDAGRRRLAETLKAQPGHVTHVLEAGELARWREKLAPLRASWVATANAQGYDGAALLKALKAIMKKYAGKN